MLLAVTAVLALPAAAAAAPSSVADAPTWTAGYLGTGSAVGPDGDRAWMVGSFNMAAPRTGPGTGIDTSGAAIPGYAELTDSPAGLLHVYSAIPDGAGGWYVAGNFNNAGGIARPGLVHLGSDGAVDQNFNAQATAGSVRTLALSGGTLFVGGNFTSVGGAARQSLAALNPATGTALGGFTPAINAGGNVTSLATLAGNIYAGGSFTDGARQNLIKVDALGALDAAFNPDPSGGTVRAILANGVSIYAGGSFTTMFGGAVGSLVKIDVAGPALDAGWTPAPNGIVNALATDGTNIYAGGTFSTFGGATRVRLGATALTGTGTAAAWYPGPVSASNVNALAIAGGNVYIGGDFQSVNGQPRHNLAAAAADVTGALQGWAPEASDFVFALGATASAIYAGGQFGGVGGRALMSLYPVDLLTGAAMPFFSHDFSGGIGNDLRSIAVCGNAIYVAGTFSQVDGVLRLNAAAFDRNTGALLPWDPDVDNDVNVVVCGDGVVYLGGIFNILNFTPPGAQVTRNGLAAVDPVTGAPTGWDPAGAGVVDINAMALSGSTLYVGGNFATIGNPVAVARPNVAALDTADSSATSWNPAVTNTGIQTIALSSSELYLGGSITAPFVRSVAVRVSDASIDPAWNPAPDAAVQSLAVAPDGTVYMGGSFQLVTGQPRQFAASLTPVGALTGWNPAPDAAVNQVTVGADGRVYLAGGFTGTNSHATRFFATYSEPTSFATQPSLTAAPVEGQPATCSATPGGSLPAPQTIQWQLDGSAIAGAIGSTYTPTGADVGHALSCNVFQRNLISSVQADSAPATVAAAPAAPAAPPPPPFDIDGFATPPPPVRGKSVIVQPIKGVVTVLLPGFKQYVPLPDAERIPVGTVVDARRGVVKLTSVGAKGKLQTAIFYEGVFQVFQKKPRNSITELRLYGGNFSVCKKAKRAIVLAAGKIPKSKSIRHLWGKGSGLFRTKGRYASATIRGTTWLTDDRCDGTLVRVTRGAVTVRDLPKKKSLVLKAPKSYLALARK